MKVAALEAGMSESLGRLRMQGSACLSGRCNTGRERALGPLPPLWTR